MVSPRRPELNIFCFWKKGHWDPVRIQTQVFLRPISCYYHWLDSNIGVEDGWYIFHGHSLILKVTLPQLWCWKTRRWFTHIQWHCAILFVHCTIGCHGNILVWNTNSPRDSSMSSVSIGGTISTRVCALRTLSLAAVTIQGWCSFHSELLIVRLLFGGGDYSGRHLMEEIWYFLVQSLLSWDAQSISISQDILWHGGCSVHVLISVIVPGCSRVSWDLGMLAHKRLVWSSVTNAAMKTICTMYKWRMAQCHWTCVDHLAISQGHTVGTLIANIYKVTRAHTFTILHCGFRAAWVPHTSRRFGSPGILLYTRMWFLHAKLWPYRNRKVN